ncbi:hypothetical protein GCM10011579_015350 [Streptomyces albiflavescens]|uniref:Uncharacterized protein n=1 Tax=Streptomyces albiflavescens TaxID=1623582 RepID=A0A918D132_9ACTN|nr:hypothetical protein GCM10011579_015350 [Streptomyces albiflavescens]
MGAVCRGDRCARRPYFFVALAAFATLENVAALPTREAFGLLRPSWWYAPEPQVLAHAGVSLNGARSASREPNGAPMGKK